MPPFPPLFAPSVQVPCLPQIPTAAATAAGKALGHAGRLQQPPKLFPPPDSPVHPTAAGTAP
eukprot:scaffold23695_cov19-Tisochrysis_lutea.AAC.1